VRDSAGIQIVDAATDTTPAQWLRHEDVPSVRIGQQEGAAQYLLYQIRGVRSLSDGSVLVLNAGTHEIRRFDSTGQWLSTSGGQGRGPGELQFPVMLRATVGDSSFVLDIGQPGLHVVDPAGRLVRTRATPTSYLSGFVGLLDSTIAVVAAPRFERGVYERVLTAEVVLATVDLATSKVDTAGILPGPQEYHYTHGDLVRSVPVPLTGMPAVAVSDRQIFVSDRHSPEIRVYDAGGDLRRILRLSLVPTPLHVDDWNILIDEYLNDRARMTGGEGRLARAEVARQRDVLNALQQPSTMPFFDMIIVNDSNAIWLRRVAVNTESQRWIKIDGHGSVAASALVPARLIVREINDDWVLGLERDDLDVEYVVRYRLRRVEPQ
jgi:hypothetical protein